MIASGISVFPVKFPTELMEEMKKSDGERGAEVAKEMSDKTPSRDGLKD